eukprot:131013-Prorocentrum_minimum.AAC.2
MGPRVCPRCVPGGKLRRGPESSPKGVQRGAGNGHEGVHIRAGKDICPVGVGWRRGSSQPISRPSASSASATSSVASRNADRSRSGEPDAAAPPLDLAWALSDGCVAVGCSGGGQDRRRDALEEKGGHPKGGEVSGLEEEGGGGGRLVMHKLSQHLPAGRVGHAPPGGSLALRNQITIARPISLRNQITIARPISSAIR